MMMKPGNQPWSRYAAKIDALSLRERGILFGSALLAVAALADVLVLTPASTEQEQIKTRLAKLSTELATLRTQVGSEALGKDVSKKSPRTTLLAAIQQTKQARSAMDELLRQSLASPEQMARLPDLMSKVMRKQPNLTLTKLATIAPDQDRALLDKLTKVYQPSTSSAVALAGSVPVSGAALQSGQDLVVHMHGVDVGVTGPYLQLNRYLIDLERALPGLRWGELRVHAEPAGTSPPLMEVRVYLMGASS